MQRAIASLLLLGLGVAFVVHPLAHGLEDHPEACAVAQLGQASPAALPGGAPVLLSDTTASELVAGPLLSSSDVSTPLPSSRGPPAA